MTDFDDGNKFFFSNSGREKFKKCDSAFEKKGIIIRRFNIIVVRFLITCTGSIRWKSEKRHSFRRIQRPIVMLSQGVMRKLSSGAERTKRIKN